MNVIGDIQPVPVPADQARAFAPATHCLYEWSDYWFKAPGADRLQVGSTWLAPVDAEAGLFRVRFENQLGLTRLQPFAGPQPLAEPFVAEVISPKFPSPARHLTFLRGLLDDLFARAARLPFTVRAATERRVTETRRPPTPLFIYHFLCQHGPALLRALEIVEASPHRVLADHPEQVPLGAVTEVDADVIIEILHTPEQLMPARGLAVAQALRGQAPVRVWQRRPLETFNTPPNRFVRAFLRQVLAGTEALPAQSWWRNAPAERQALIRRVQAVLQQDLRQTFLAEVGEMTVFPSNSQVLLRREGYRDLLALWRLFNTARRPLFTALQHALEIRDIAKLYEMWGFFTLTEQIGVWLAASPAIELTTTDEAGLNWGARANYGEYGALTYNETFTPPRSYSLQLRPDYTWRRAGRLEVVLDAKFRLERRALDPGGSDEADATARRADIYKMHTYRDALGVRAAVAVYPGDTPVFYPAAGAGDSALRDIVLGEAAGVGAFPLAPGKESA